MDQAGQDAFAHRPTLVRTAVEQTKEFAAQVEHGDLPPANRYKFPLTRRDLRDGGYDVLAHDLDVPA